jgi:hypothetical protein
MDCMGKSTPPTLHCMPPPLAARQRACRRTRNAVRLAGQLAVDGQQLGRRLVQGIHRLGVFGPPLQALAHHME